MTQERNTKKLEPYKGQHCIGERGAFRQACFQDFVSWTVSFKFFSVEVVSMLMKGKKKGHHK